VETESVAVESSNIRARVYKTGGEATFSSDNNAYANDRSLCIDQEISLVH